MKDAFWTETILLITFNKSGNTTIQGRISKKKKKLYMVGYIFATIIYRYADDKI